MIYHEHDTHMIWHACSMFIDTKLVWHKSNFDASSACHVRINTTYLDTSHHRCRSIFLMRCIAVGIPKATPYLLWSACLRCTNNPYQSAAAPIIICRKHEKLKSGAIDNLPRAIRGFRIDWMRWKCAFHAGRQ